METQTLPQPIHIICPFSSWATEGGVWWHALGLYDVLKSNGQVELWTELEPSQRLAAYPIRRIRPFRGEVPHGGTMIFVGMAHLPGNWYDHASPAKVMLECTLFAPAKLYHAINRLSLNGKIEVEVGYPSSMVEQLCGVPGKLRMPIHGLAPFLQVKRTVEERPFMIGKVSRDSLLKHHFRDVGLYRQLAGQDFRIKIVGSTCLKPYFQDDIDNNISLLPEMPRHELPDFFAQLDCFFYRTPLHCPENLGVVILEAMASGLPIVAHRQGGYRDVIEHGKNGYLFDSDEEALKWLAELRAKPALRNDLGAHARETAIAWQSRRISI